MPEYCRITIDVPFTHRCNAVIVAQRLIDDLVGLQKRGMHGVHPDASIDFDTSWLTERDPLAKASAQIAMYRAAKAARENLEKLDILQKGSDGLTGRIHIDNHGKELLIDVRNGLIKEVTRG